jgi:hypothetical protein
MDLTRRISQQDMSIHDLNEANLKADRVRKTEYDLSQGKQNKIIVVNELKWRSDIIFP